ncbi:MAG TPA: DUF3999 domain-containing protein [Candidatus Binatia bacterium]|jgi:hypothetical protein
MKSIVALLLLAHGSAFAAERPEEFAYGISIHADAQDALYEVEIPAVVYRGVTRSDLGDIRVFNGQGELVPHGLRPRAVTSTESVPAVSLPVFPLYGEASDKLEDLSVRIEKRSDGTIVSIRGQAKKSAAKGKLRGYLLDASALKRAVQALRFDWQSGADGFVGRVRVEGSDDLSAWSTVAAGAALVRLSFGGHQLQQNRVELHAVKFKYLRVSWAENQRPVESLTVLAEPAAGTVFPRRVWQKITGEAVAGKAGEYRYDLGGPFPFDRLRVELPQINSLVQLQILARQKTNEDWHLVTNATAYRLRDRDAEVTSPEIAVISRGDRYWLLRIDQKGGGLGTGMPVISVGWVPQKLVFAARGAGPFQLAYGNVEAKSVAYSIDSLIPGYKTDAEFKVKTASLGEQVTLAGPARLRAPMDYKKWALWGSLILGVLLLGWMAYRLARQVLNAPADSHVTDKSK